MALEMDQFMAGLVRRNPGEKEFHQAVRAVAEKVLPFITENPVRAVRYERSSLKPIRDYSLADGAVE